MKPCRNRISPHEHLFNENHCKLRKVIERCFGVLKNPLRCLIGYKELHYSPAKVTQIVNVCCTLHNMCRFFKNNWTEDDSAQINVSEKEGEEVVEDQGDDIITGNSVRDATEHSL